MSEQGGREKCCGVTRDRDRCKSYPMRGSRYCYVHSLGRLRGVPVVKNATVHAVLGTVLGVVGIVMSLWFGLVPSRAQKEQMRIGLDTNRGVESIKEMLESVERRQSQRLLGKYPEGYVLFVIDPSLRKTESAIPQSSTISQEYEFNWARVRISEISQKVVTIEMPDILYKPTNGQFIGTAMGLVRRPLGRERRFPLKPKGSTHAIFIELVEDSSSRFAFAIGFRQE